MHLFARLTKPLATTSVAMLCTACSFSSPTLQETRELETRITEGTRFEIDAGAGSLTLTGNDAANVIQVRAEIYQTSANDDYTLTLELQEDGQARLVADAASSIGGGSDRIDLSITVPERIHLTVRDGSGSIRIDRLTGNLKIDDGSGSIRVADIEGNVTIEDGSGSISVTQITGDVSIDDGSGSITVMDAGGKVKIEDGSGSIDVDGAADFELIDDGSGSVSKRNIRSSDSGTG